MMTGGPFAHLKRWLRGRMWAGRLNREIDEELHYHLEMRITESIQRGMSPLEARRAALTRFGSVADVTAECRTIHQLPSEPRSGVTTMQSIWQDIRFAFRSFAKRPSFTFVAVATLALGIGGNTAIFSAVYTIVIRPLPFPDADRLAHVWLAQPDQQVWIIANRQAVDAWIEQATTVDAILAHNSKPIKLYDRGEPERITAKLVSPDAFAFLGMGPRLGRGFVAADTEKGAERVVMLSESFWRTRFGGRREAVGESLVLDDSTYTIVGVLPARADRFAGAEHKIWMPLRDTDPLTGTNAMIRLAAGVTEEAVVAELGEIRSRLDLSAEDRVWEPTLVRQSTFIGSDFRRGLWVLFGAVGFVLLIACANVANMLLARGVGRRHEIAMRTAIGGSRGRIVRQLLTESLVLAGLGCAAGVGLAVLGVNALRHFAPAELSELQMVHVEPAALLFTVLVGLASGALFGVAPAVQLSRFDVSSVLGVASRSYSPRGGWTRQALVTLEVALALVLFVGAGLMVNTLVNLQNRDPGFASENLASISVSLPHERYPEAENRAPVLEDILARVRQLPGVRAATYALTVPPRFAGMIGRLEFDGLVAREPSGVFISGNSVSPEYFDVVRTPIQRGRTFARSASEIPSPIVVNEFFANAFWPDEDPLGKRFRLGPENPEDDWKTVIGVAGDVVGRSVREVADRFQIYTPFGELGRFRSATLIVRAAGDPEMLLGLIKGQIWSVDPKLPVPDAATVDQVLADVIARPRFNATLLSSFAVIALILAAIGVYGVISLSAQQRIREIGVRVALGAKSSDVMRLMVTQGLGPMLLGVVLGVGTSFGLTRFLQNLLFGVGTYDLVTYALAIAVLLGTGLLASYLPARRATRVDPVEALRSE